MRVNGAILLFIYVHDGLLLPGAIHSNDVVELLIQHLIVFDLFIISVFICHLFILK